MKTFTKSHIAKKISHLGISAVIYKFKKEGTERIFWAAEITGNVNGRDYKNTRVSSTMYSRLYDCTKDTKNFLLSVS